MYQQTHLLPITIRPQVAPQGVQVLPAAGTPELTALKRRFAEALVKNPQEPFKAAVSAVGEALAGYVFHPWQADPEVTAMCSEIIEKAGGEEGLLESKAEFCRRLLKIAERLEIPSPKDALAAMDLLATVRGFKAKPADTTITNNNTQIVNKVMLVASHADEDAWEKAASKQQRKLIDVAATTIKDVSDG